MEEIFNTGYLPDTGNKLIYNVYNYKLNKKIDCHFPFELFASGVKNRKLRLHKLTLANYRPTGKRSTAKE